MFLSVTRVEFDDSYFILIHQVALLGIFLKHLSVVWLLAVFVARPLATSNTWANMLEQELSN